LGLHVEAKSAVWGTSNLKRLQGKGLITRTGSHEQHVAEALFQQSDMVIAAGLSPIGNSYSCCPISSDFGPNHYLHATVSRIKQLREEGWFLGRSFAAGAGVCNRVSARWPRIEIHETR
jgi:hypothetical protein